MTGQNPCLDEDLDGFFDVNGIKLRSAQEMEKEKERKYTSSRSHGKRAPFLSSSELILKKLIVQMDAAVVS